MRTHSDRMNWYAVSDDRGKALMGRIGHLLTALYATLWKKEKRYG